MSPSFALVGSLLLGLVAAQTPGTAPEVHPKLTTWKCTNGKKGCVEQKTAVVLDSATHWIHQKNNTSVGCSVADKAACPDEASCAKNCVIDGISTYADYGVTTQGGNLKMTMYGKNGVASPRIYLLAEGEQKYEMMKLVNKEFTFDIDASKLPCGMNSALYLSEMKENGGKDKYNAGGAAYGTGYCDAQCFVTPWVEGKPNIKGEGICCNEMDIWEANGRANQLAPHSCNKPGLYRCNGDECGASGVCDKNGCGLNPYRIQKDYYGPKLIVDTTRPFSVVTEFPGKDGVLQSINRKYVQDGKVYSTPSINVTHPMDDKYCNANGATMFEKLGGMKAMGDSLNRGMVLAMSIWWDEGGFMNWLDSGDAGPCNATEGDPKVVQTIEKNPTVIFSQIKWGEIGSTYKGRPANRWARDE